MFAVAEIVCGLAISRFFDWGRAEALLFYAFRPWLLLLGALCVSQWKWQGRFAFYALALVTAGLSESLFLIVMSAVDPWPEMLRGWAGGAFLVLVFDLVLKVAAHARSNTGRRLATAVIAGLLLIPGTLMPYERILLFQPSHTIRDRPRVTVMTSLPIIWGEGGAFGSGPGPPASWRLLAREFILRPIDFIDPASLRQANILLLAQPRQLAPRELVALDEWVRGGGRTLILADPLLIWPSGLPPGDVRRPVVNNMIIPLLSYWGVSIGPPVETPRIVRLGNRRLQLSGTASLAGADHGCRREAVFLLHCQVGVGRAIIVADADLLHDSNFLLPGMPIARESRLSDNPLFIADSLDRLANLDRARIAGDVQWADTRISRVTALGTGAMPIALILALGGLAWSHRSRYSRTYPQGSEPETGVRTNQE